MNLRKNIDDRIIRYTPVRHIIYRLIELQVNCGRYVHDDMVTMRQEVNRPVEAYVCNTIKFTISMHFHIFKPCRVSVLKELRK